MLRSQLSASPKDGVSKEWFLAMSDYEPEAEADYQRYQALRAMAQRPTNS